jgi:hypothetical protein
MPPGVRLSLLHDEAHFLSRTAGMGLVVVASGRGVRQRRWLMG